MRRPILLLMLACFSMQVCRAQSSGSVSLRTNLLFDAAVIPNVGVEWGMGGRWSMLTNGMFIWLKNDNRHRYWRWAVGDVELRCWLIGSEWLPLERRWGWHVGPYAAVYRYDVEFGGEGQRSDFNWGVGGAVGYMAYRPPLESRLHPVSGLHRREIQEIPSRGQWLYVGGRLPPSLFRADKGRGGAGVGYRP